MKEWICREMSTSTSGNENGVLMMKTELVRCVDCKHRPWFIEDGNGFRRYFFPDDKCPCQCDDWWYNWMPEDDWFCANGERREL